MKSILKQALTVVLLLSVPAVFAADVAKEATRFEKAKNVVVGAAKAGYNKSAAKAAQFRGWMMNPNDTKLNKAVKASAVLAVAGAAVYFVGKLYSMYTNYKAKNAKLAAGKVAAEKAHAELVAAEKAKAEQVERDAQYARELAAQQAAPVVKTAQQIADEQSTANMNARKHLYA